MKKLLALVNLFTLLFLTNCKKDSHPSDPKPAAQIQAQGTWSLLSYTGSSYGAPFSYTTSQYPCIANNKLIVNAGGTLSQEYTANDTCYLEKTQNSYSTLGMAGDKRAGTWSQDGDTFYMQMNGYSKRPGELSILNGETHLIFRDTLSQINQISVLVFIK